LNAFPCPSGDMRSAPGNPGGRMPSIAGSPHKPLLGTCLGLTHGVDVVDVLTLSEQPRA